MRAIVGLLIGGAVLLTAPLADARTVKVGSDLKAPADVARAKPVDSAYWPKTRAGGPKINVPFKGQATEIRMKGGIVLTPGSMPFDTVRFQVLRPVGAKWLVVVTSEDFTAPAFADPNRITAYRSQFLCVKKGDRIALSNSGGFGNGYPNGVPFRTFARVPGAATNAFTGAGKNMNGSKLRPRAVKRTELLVQATVVNGSKARPFCRQ